MSSLETVPTAGKSIQAITEDFVQGKNDVPKVLGKPSFTAAKPVLDLVEANLIAMTDRRDPRYGKLHLIKDTSLLPNGPALQVVQSVDQGQTQPYVAPTTVREMQNYLHDYRRDQEYWLNDQNAKEVVKKFIISRFDEVYFDELKDTRFGYKGVTTRDLIDLLIADFPATPEEQAAVKKLIEADWDPNQHIVKLFLYLKEHLTTLAKMKGAVAYTDDEFVEAVYMAVQKTKQFTKVCAKWKQKPAIDRATEAQARTYFKDAYEIFDLERNSFHKLGIANNIVMQEKLDSLAAENAVMKQQIAADRATSKQYHQIFDHAMSMTTGTEPTTDTERDDNTLQTQWSAFTASQAANTETQFADLRRQLEQCMKNATPSCPPAIIDTSTKTGGKKRKGPLSDGPEGVTKTKKFYKNCDNACWSCGYDVLKLHDSRNCRNKLKGHIDSHMGANPQPGASQKDKEFSKWK